MKATTRVCSTCNETKRSPEEITLSASRCRRCQSIAMRARNYGILPADVLALYESADWRCEVCQEPLTIDANSHIDHDNECCNRRSSSTPACGRCVRGVLCSKCNYAVSQIEWYREHRDAVEAYLDRGRRTDVVSTGRVWGERIASG